MSLKQREIKFKPRIKLTTTYASKKFLPVLTKSSVRPYIPPTPLCCVSLSEMPHVLARSLRRIYQISVFSGGWWWLGGGGVLNDNKVFYREAPHPGPTPSPQFIYHFWHRGYPFRIPSTDKWIPSHIPSMDLCIPFNCDKCSVFKYVINHKSEYFLSTFPQLYEVHLVALLGLFIDRKDRFPYPFIIEVKSLPPFHIPEAWQRYPFRAESPRLGHYRKYRGGRGQQLITNMYWRTRGWWCIRVFQIISMLNE